MTEYVVLKQDEVTGSWRVVAADRQGFSADSAIRATFSGDDTDSGIYVAVPSRSWTPRQVKVEQMTRIRVGDAE